MAVLYDAEWFAKHRNLCNKGIEVKSLSSCDISEAKLDSFFETLSPCQPILLHVLGLRSLTSLSRRDRGRLLPLCKHKCCRTQNPSIPLWH